MSTARMPGRAGHRTPTSDKADAANVGRVGDARERNTADCADARSARKRLTTARPLIDPLAAYLAAKPEPHAGKTEADLIRAATAAGLRVAVEPARTGQTYRLEPKGRARRVVGPAMFSRLTEAYGFALDTQRRLTAEAQVRRSWR